MGTFELNLDKILAAAFTFALSCSARALHEMV